MLCCWRFFSFFFIATSPSVHIKCARSSGIVFFPHKHSLCLFFPCCMIFIVFHCRLTLYMCLHIWLPIRCYRACHVFCLMIVHIYRQCTYYAFRCPTFVQNGLLHLHFFVTGYICVRYISLTKFFFVLRKFPTTVCTDCIQWQVVVIHHWYLFKSLNLFPIPQFSFIGYLLFSAYSLLVFFSTFYSCIIVFLTFSTFIKLSNINRTNYI